MEYYLLKVFIFFLFMEREPHMSVYIIYMHSAVCTIYRITLAVFKMDEWSDIRIMAAFI